MLWSKVELFNIINQHRWTFMLIILSTGFVQDYKVGPLSRILAKLFITFFIYGVDFYYPQSHNSCMNISIFLSIYTFFKLFPRNGVFINKLISTDSWVIVQHVVVLCECYTCTYCVCMLYELCKHVTTMHGKNVEFGHLIPGKYVLLVGNLCYFEGKYLI